MSLYENDNRYDWVDGILDGSFEEVATDDGLPGIQDLSLGRIVGFLLRRSSVLLCTLIAIVAIAWTANAVEDRPVANTAIISIVIVDGILVFFVGFLGIQRQSHEQTHPQEKAERSVEPDAQSGCQEPTGEVAAQNGRGYVDGSYPQGDQVVRSRS